MRKLLRGRPPSANLCLGACLLFALVHILFFRNGFFDINRSKYYLFVWSMPAAALAAAALRARERLRERGRPAAPARGLLRASRAASAGMALLFASAAVSVCLAPDRRAALTGSAGRCAGGLFFGALALLYALGLGACRALPGEEGPSLRAAPLLVGALLASGSVCALLGVCNFLGLDPLGFYVASLRPVYRNDFISTIGNINFFSAYMCLVAALAAGLFVCAGDSPPALCRSATAPGTPGPSAGDPPPSGDAGRSLRAFPLDRLPEAGPPPSGGAGRNGGRAGGLLRWLCLPCFVLAWMGVLASRSESGMAGVFALGLAALAFPVRSQREAGRLLVLPASACLAAVLLRRLLILRRGYYMELYDSIARTLLRAPGAMLAAGLALLVPAALLFALPERPALLRGLRRAQKALLACAGAALLAAVGLVVYYTALAPGAAPPIPALRMDARWGTYRGFIWPKTLSLWGELPLRQKLFGVGPDCLRALLVEKCYDEMVSLTGILFDNAHNEFLQLLVTVGAAGLAGYILLALGALRRAWRAGREDAVARAVCVALCAHLAQSFFNIAQPETTPAVFLLFALAAAQTPRARRAPGGG